MVAPETPGGGGVSPTLQNNVVSIVDKKTFKDCQDEYDKKVFRSSRDNAIRQGLLVLGLIAVTTFSAGGLGVPALIAATATSGASSGVAIAQIVDAEKDRKECIKKVRSSRRAG